MWTVRLLHSLDFAVTLLFGLTSSSSDVNSSLTLFILVLAFEGGFFDDPPALVAPSLDGGFPPAFEGGLGAIFDGGMAFPFGSSSSSSVANGSSSTFFFLSCSFGLACGFELDSVLPSPLLSPTVISALLFLDFAASRPEKNSSLSCC